jgi:hypothetical protein
VVLRLLPYRASESYGSQRRSGWRHVRSGTQADLTVDDAILLHPALAQDLNSGMSRNQGSIGRIHGQEDVHPIGADGRRVRGARV